MNFQAILDDILDGEYDCPNGEKLFREDVLKWYGDTAIRREHNAALFDRLMTEHNDLQGAAKLEEVLGDFVKICK